MAKNKQFYMDVKEIIKHSNYDLKYLKNTYIRSKPDFLFKTSIKKYEFNGWRNGTDKSRNLASRVGALKVCNQNKKIIESLTDEDWFMINSL